MALQIYHVTAAGGLKLFVGHDAIDGQPIGPISVAQNQTFFADPHQSGWNALYRLANASKYTTGAGSTPVTYGTYGVRFRQGSGIPGNESE